MIGLLHCTQSDPGTFLGNFNWFTYTHPEWCPNTLIDPSTRERWRPIAAGLPSKALLNQVGGVETNNRPGGVHQVEIVGRTPDIQDYSAEWYRVCAEMLAEEAEYAGFYNIFYPDNDRFSFEKWSAPLAPIWYKHVNVPENNHTDPGTLRLDLLEATVITPEDARAIAAAVWASPIEAVNDALNDTDPFPAGSVLGWAHQEGKTIRIRYSGTPPTTLNITTVPDELLLAEVARRFRL